MRIQLFGALAAGLLGCARLSGGPAGAEADKYLITNMRPAPPPDLRTVSVTVERSELQKALGRTDLHGRVRLVPILRPESEKIPYPEYRLFDVREGSAYALLGLQNADVLVAADGYVLKDPQTFPIFVQLLRGQPGGKIEIVRGGEPILMEYRFAG